jgi:hypothetical protein
MLMQKHPFHVIAKTNFDKVKFAEATPQKPRLRARVEAIVDHYAKGLEPKPVQQN